MYDRGSPTIYQNEGVVVLDHHGPFTVVSTWLDDIHVRVVVSGTAAQSIQAKGTGYGGAAVLNKVIRK